MATTPKFKDRVQVQSTTTGTGTYTVGGALAAEFRPASDFADGDTALWVAFEAGVGWEFFVGTVGSSGTTITRDKVLFPTSGSPVSWSAGTRTIQCVDGGAANALPSLTDFGGRLTLETGVGVSLTDQTAKTDLYYTPFSSNRLISSNGVMAYRQLFTQLTLKATDTQTGTTSNGSAVITGLTSTAQLVRGMKATGTGVGAAAVIGSIDSLTQVTLSVNSTASASVSIAFKLPADTNYDILNVMGVLRYSRAWSGANSPTDALAFDDQIGVPVNTSSINSGDHNGIAAKTGVWLGTIRTTATDGQIEFSQSARYVWNLYNQVPLDLMKYEISTSHTYSTGTWREWNGGTGGPHRVHFVTGLAQRFLTGGWAEIGATSAIAMCGWTFNATNAEGLAVGSQQQAASRTGLAGAYLSAVGYNYLAVTQYRSSGTPNFNFYRLMATVWG